MKTFFLLAAAAALVSGQQVTNPQPFARGTPSSYDGMNRGGQPEFGTHPISLVRLGTPRYENDDGQTPIGGLMPIAFDTGLGTQSPNVRSVSNIVCGNSTSVRNTRRQLSAFHTFWGQFMDHDLGLTDGAPQFGSFNIDVTGDTVFDPMGMGQMLTFNRAIFVNETVNIPDVGDVIVRQQQNDITAWIDASYVYGEDIEKQRLLRGDECRLSDGPCPGQFLMNPQGRYGLLPSTQEVADANTGGLNGDVVSVNPVGRFPDNTMRVSGDVRAQENNALESMHTVFARDHNRCAIQLADDNSDRSSDEIFEECRFFGMAYVQNILYTEYAPLLLPSASNGMLGQNLDAVYQGYDSTMSPDVFNEFSGALFRYGHSELPTEINRANPSTNELLTPFDLASAFFNPTNTPEPVSIDEILAGLWQDLQNEVDVFVVDDIRNQLFENTAMGVANDLIAFNLQRSRDHGLPTLNQLRTAFMLTPHASFDELVGNQPGAANIAANLATVYASVDDVELWIGGVAEDQYMDGNFGETLTFIVSLQYQRFRESDNYYWENGWFSDDEENDIRGTVLSTIILRNTMISEMPCAAMTFSATQDQMMCENMFNSASATSFGIFTVFATIAAFFF